MDDIDLTIDSLLSDRKNWDRANFFENSRDNIRRLVFGISTQIRSTINQMSFDSIFGTSIIEPINFDINSIEYLFRDYSEIDPWHEILHGNYRHCDCCGVELYPWNFYEICCKCDWTTQSIDKFLKITTDEQRNMEL